MTYIKMVEMIRNAFINDDFAQLQKLKHVNPIWWHDIIKEFVIESLNTALSGFNN